MTNLNETIAHKPADDNLISGFLACLPTAGDVIEAAAALATAVMLTVSLNLML